MRASSIVQFSIANYCQWGISTPFLKRLVLKFAYCNSMVSKTHKYKNTVHYLGFFTPFLISVLIVAVFLSFDNTSFFIVFCTPYVVLAFSVSSVLLCFLFCLCFYVCLVTKPILSGATIKICTKLNCTYRGGTHYITIWNLCNNIIILQLWRVPSFFFFWL